MKFQKLANASRNRIEFAEKLGMRLTNGRDYKRMNSFIKQYHLDVQHFVGHSNWKRITSITVIKKCPVCNSKFETKIYPNAKTKRKQDGNITCSASCSNTMFRSDENNGNYISGKCSYRQRAFRIWKRKCAICNWDVLVEIHHIDLNRNNNIKENLIPLCPNHHTLTQLSKNDRRRIRIEKEMHKIITNKFQRIA